MSGSRVKNIFMSPLSSLLLSVLPSKLGNISVYLCHRSRPNRGGAKEDAVNAEDILSAS
jgi:hypothetical protein